MIHNRAPLGWTGWLPWRATVSGFTIYETMRVFLPGGLAIFVLDLTIRLATSNSPIAASPSGSESLLHTIESPGGFVALSLAAGLFLYLRHLAPKPYLFGRAW